MLRKKPKSPQIEGLLHQDSFSSKPVPKTFSLSKSSDSRSSPSQNSMQSLKTRLLNKISHFPAKILYLSKIQIASILIAAIIILLGILYIFKYQFARPGDNSQLIKDTIITNNTELAVDMTFNLTIIILGQPQAIPNTFGQVDNGRMIINSSTDDGTIRVQSPTQRKFFLTDFFTVWEAPFNQRCIFSRCADDKRQLVMYVNGEPNQEYEKYQLQDGDDIRIILEKR